MCRGWKNFEMDIIKSFDFCDLNFKSNSSKGSEQKKDSCKESLHLLREYLTHHKQNVDTIIDREVHSGEISEGVKEHYWTIEKR